MKSVVLSEKRNPKTVDIDIMNAEQIAKLLNDEDKKVPKAVEKCVPVIAEAIELIAQSFLKGGRLAYFGAGTSGRLGVLDASECWPTFGVEYGMVEGFIAGGDKALRYAVENAEDKAELGVADLESFNPNQNDVVVGISACGSPRYVLSVLEEARKRGCKTIGITSNPDAELKKFSDIFINPIVGEEAITGSSRMKSGSAQKMVLNMLSTGAMIRIGKTYENYMIDLRMVNEKLIDRATRIVSEIAKISYQEAVAFLKKSNNNVKIACVMAVKNCTKREAEEMLSEHGGILRKVI